MKNFGLPENRKIMKIKLRENFVIIDIIFYLSVLLFNF